MGERDLRWLNSHGNESSIFYRLILPSILQHKKLSIPGKFVKNLGIDLPSIVAITTPNGYSWSVRLQKNDGKVCFTQGWHEFVENQSIRVGYLLVFTYKGNSSFSVNIFDTASAEIKYQHGNQFPVSTGGGTGAGVQCNVSDHMTSDCEIKPQSFSQQPDAPKKRKRGSGTSKKGNDVQSPETVSNSGNSSRKWRVITPEEKERVLNASKMFESENPFCRVFLRRSYVYKGIGLHMPSSFSEKYLGAVTGFVTLQVSSGEKWPVRCMWRDGSAKLSKGWLEFVRDNQLEEGDVCVFELIKMGDAVLKVTIFRLPREVPLLNQVPEEHLGDTPRNNQLHFAYDINGRNS